MNLDPAIIFNAIEEQKREKEEKLAAKKRRKLAALAPWEPEEIERLLLAEQMFPKKEKGSDDEYESDEDEREKRRLKRKAGYFDPPERGPDGVLRYEKRDRWDRIAAFVGKVRTYRDCHRQINKMRNDRKNEKRRKIREEKGRISVYVL